MYKYILLLLLLLFIIISCSNEKQTEVPDTIREELRGNAAEFVSSLGKVLLSEVQNNGILRAVSVCSDTAQAMTNNFSIKRGIYLKRVSSRYRNPNNKPDAFEKEALDYFQKLKSENKIDSLTEYIRIISENDVQSIRYMKPIIVQPLCLNCHGAKDQIMPEVQKIINERYPQDKAINYSTGDLRGAVSIQKVL